MAFRKLLILFGKNNQAGGQTRKGFMMVIGEKNLGYPETSGLMNVYITGVIDLECVQVDELIPGIGTDGRRSTGIANHLDSFSKEEGFNDDWHIESVTETDRDALLCQTGRAYEFQSTHGRRALVLAHFDRFNWKE